jgi:hypothetical protein
MLITSRRTTPSSSSAEATPRTAVAAVHQLESVVIEERVGGKQTGVPTHSLFVMIGAEPRTAWLDDALLRDRRGFIAIGDEIPAAALSDNHWAALERGPYLLETSLPGVFAVGDVRANSVAVGEGSIAVVSPSSTSDSWRHHGSRARLDTTGGPPGGSRRTLCDRLKAASGAQARSDSSDSSRTQLTKSAVGSTKR